MPEGRGTRPIAANVDQVFVVTAASHPEPIPQLIDRLLVVAEANDIAAAVVVNKVDLAGGGEIIERCRRAGYPVFPTSVVSGAGLKRIHAFLSRGAEPSLEPPEITRRALADRASLSAQALAIFIRCYGSFAGDMALAFFARGGVYVCGGIAAKLAGRFAEGDFMEAFNYKGRHRDIAASIPVRLVTNESLGLAGAALAAVAAD